VIVSQPFPCTLSLLCSTGINHTVKRRTVTSDRRIERRLEPRPHRRGVSGQYLLTKSGFSAGLSHRCTDISVAVTAYRCCPTRSFSPLPQAGLSSLPRSQRTRAATWAAHRRAAEKVPVITRPCSACRRRCWRLEVPGRVEGQGIGGVEPGGQGADVRRCRRLYHARAAFVPQRDGEGQAVGRPGIGFGIRAALQRGHRSRNPCRQNLRQEFDGSGAAAGAVESARTGDGGGVGS
jgi:hypothetical protein